MRIEAFKSAIYEHLHDKVLSLGFFKVPIKSLGQARYYSDTSRGEYFLIYGSFAFEDTLWGAILISTEGRILQVKQPELY